MKLHAEIVAAALFTAVLAIAHGAGAQSGCAHHNQARRNNPRRNPS